MSSPILPYEKDHNAREAVRTLLQASTQPKSHNEIVARMKISGKFIVPLLPLMFANLHNKPSILQETAFALVEAFTHQGYSMRHIAAELASHLASPSINIRETAKRLLICMQEDAKPAEDFALGCLRNHDRSIVMSGLEILLAINSAISRSISSRVIAVIEAFPNDQEIADLAQQITQLIAGTGANSIKKALAGVDINVFKNKSILLIDSNYAFRQTTALALQSLGMNVFEANSGREAAKIIKNHADNNESFDLITVELNLADINGLRILRLIMSQPILADTQVAVITSLNNERIILAARQLGAKEYILKSTGIGITLKLLSNLLSTGKHS